MAKRLDMVVAFIVMAKRLDTVVVLFIFSFLLYPYANLPKTRLRCKHCKSFKKANIQVTKLTYHNRGSSWLQ